MLSLQDRKEGKMHYTPEQLKEFINENDTFGKSNAIQITHLEEGYAEAELQVNPNSMNAVHTVQGGAIFTLADMAFAGAANSFGDKCVAMSAAVSFIRPGTGKKLFAKAKVISKGKRSCVVDVEILSEEDKLLAKLQITGFFFEKGA
jgi:acyl-CoA thioesterase